MFSINRKQQFINPYQYTHIETSHLICLADQLVGFYINETPA